MSEPSPSPSPAAPILSPATAQALELPSLLAVLSRLAACDLGRDRILALRPFAAEPALAAHRALFSEARQLLAQQPLVPDFDLPVGALLERLVSGRPPVEGADLVRLADLIKACRAAADRIRAADPPCPGLAEKARALPDLAALLRRIEKTFDRRGEIREDASPRLTTLRRQIRQVRDQLYRELGGYVSEHRAELSEDTIPMRGGRLVLMLQSGARGRGSGLLHGRSATGKSFYFEPLQVVETNNTLQQAGEDEEAERRRILTELIGDARQALPALAAHAALLAELDLLQAAGRFAELCAGTLAEIGPRHTLRLRAARHPLLDPCLADLRAEALGQAGHSGPVVPLDLDLDGDRRILVVTGPNAGGKTVALKTAGLLALAAQCGLPIPAAAGSQVPFLTSLVATVGDDQDLLADRSTFSGRLLRLKEAWEGAGPDSLVLLDELGSGTDPEEGAALAIALLESLAEKGGLAVITTHLTQLAAAALTTSGAFCAAMEFDPRTGQPTFRLLPGPPGASEALALARRLGLPAEWLARAEARLGTTHRDLRRLLAEVEKLRQELAGARQRLAEEVADAEKLRRRLEAERAALAEERQAVARRARAEIDAFRRETADRLRGEVQRMQERFAAGRRRGLAAEAAESLFAAAPAFALPEPEPSGPLLPGEPVRHLGFGWQGILEKLEGDRAEVLVRGKRLRCRPEELAPAGPATPPGAPLLAAAPGAGARGVAARGRKPSAVPSARSSSAAAGPSAAGGPVGLVSRTGQTGDLDEAAAVPAELNLIGQRVEAALEELDGYLDRALLASRRQVRVIHGHGTGRLRQAIRQHLRGHAAVADVRPGEPDEGGNGATVVTLRG